MHLGSGSLPAFLIATLWLALSGAPAGPHNSAVLAQAATPTITVAGDSTTTVTPAATLEVTATATVDLSGTGTVTSSATLTQTRVTSTYTAIPLPTQAPQPAGSNLQINPFDWGFLTSPANPPTGPFSWIFLILMLGLIGAGIYAYRVLRPRWKGTNPVLYKAAGRFAQPAIWIGALGLIFMFFRVISLDFFNLRIWLYLVALALLGLIGWVLYWYRNSYPREIERFRKTQKARQYMPAGAKSQVRPQTGPSTAVAPPRSGKTRKKK